MTPSGTAHVRRAAPAAFESVDPGLGKIGALQPLGGGRLIERIAFPMKKVTSVEVGAGRVFVTTANKEPDAAAYFAATGAGSVFEVLTKGNGRT